MYVNRNDFKIGQAVHINISDRLRSKSTDHYFAINDMNGYICRTDLSTIGVEVKEVKNKLSKNGIWWLHQEEIKLISKIAFENKKPVITSEQNSLRNLKPGTVVNIKFISEQLKYDHYLKANNTNFIILSNKANGIELYSRDIVNTESNSGIFRVNCKRIEEFEIINNSYNVFDIGEIVYMFGDKQYTIKSIRYSLDVGYEYYIELLPEEKKDDTTNRWYEEKQLHKTKLYVKQYSSLSEVEKPNLLSNYLRYANNLERSLPKGVCLIHEINRKNKKEEENKMDKILENSITRAKTIISEVRYVKLNKIKEGTELKEKEISCESKAGELSKRHREEIKKELIELKNETNQNMTIDIGINVLNFLTDKESCQLQEVLKEYAKQSNDLHDKFNRITKSIELCTTPEQVNDFLKSQGFIDKNGLIIDPKEY